MELSQQCVSLEFAKKIKALGIKQESLFYWYKNHAGWQLRFKNNHQSLEEEYGYFWEDNQYYSAFTVAELGTMLLWDIVISRNINKEWIVTFQANGLTEDEVASYKDSNEANARAMMLIYLLKNNLLTL